MYDFWYDYIKPKHGEKQRLCHIECNSIDSPLTMEKNKKNNRLNER